MCTVSFIPLENSDDFFFTSTRDENPNRQSSVFEFHEEKKLFYAADPINLGTWFAVSPQGNFACLLNGAYQNHIKKEFYKKSRGLVILEILRAENPLGFIKNYDFSEIEPFTLILYLQKDFFQLKWDGENLDVEPLQKTLPKIWSSVTLYNETVRQKRETWFSDFLNLQKQKMDTNSILHFHMNAGEEFPEENINMCRNEGKMRSLSICSLEKKGSCILVQYLDLLDNTTKKMKIELV